MRNPMPEERPPTTDAEFTVVRGPWPRWALHVSLVRLVLRTAAAVAIGIALGVLLIVLLS